MPDFELTATSPDGQTVPFTVTAPTREEAAQALGQALDADPTLFEKKLASMGKAEPPAQEQPPAPVAAPEQAPPEEPSMFDKLTQYSEERGVAGVNLDAAKVAGETALSAVTGLGASALGGFIGTLALVTSGGDVDRSVRIIEAIQENLTYSPKADATKAVLKAAAPVAEGLDQIVDAVATMDFYDMAGVPEEQKKDLPPMLASNPLKSTLARTFLEGGSALFAGGRLNPKQGAGFWRKEADQQAKEIVDMTNKAMKAAEEDAARLGIRVTPKTVQADTVRAALEMRGDVVRGAEMAEVQQALRLARDKDKAEVVNPAWDDYRATRTYIKKGNLKGLAKNIKGHLSKRGFYMKDNPQVKSVLSDLNKVSKARYSIAFDRNIPKKQAKMIRDISLRELDSLSRRAGRLAENLKGGQKSAMIATRKQIDDFIDEQFDKDMVSGDPDAMDLWKNAKEASRRHHERFNADRLLTKFMDEEADPSTLRKWVFGAAESGARTEAASVVRRMKKVLGEDHKVFESMRQDILLDVTQPLFNIDGPNFKQFMKRYDDVLRKQPELVKEFGLDMKDLETLRKSARAASRLGKGTGPILTKEFMATALARFFFGHQISKKALKVQFARASIAKMMGAGLENRKQLLADMLDFDPHSPIFKDLPQAKRGELLKGAMVYDLMQQREDEKRD